MLQRLYQFNQIGFEFESPEKQHRAELLMLITGTMILLAVVVLIAAFVVAIISASGPIWQVPGVALGVIGAMMGVRFLIRDGHLQSAALVFAGVIIAVYLVAFLASPSATNVALVGFVVPVTVTGFVVSPRAMIWAALVLGGVVGITVLVELATGSFGEIGDERTHAGAVAQVFFGSLLIVVVIVYQYVSRSDQYFLVQRRIQRQMAGLARVSSYIRKTHDFSLPQVVEMLRVEYGIYHVRLFIREPGGARLLLTAATDQTPEQLLAEVRAINIYGSSTAALAVRQKAPVRTGLASPLPQREDFLLGVQTELAVPLLTDSQVMGVLLLQSDHEDAFDGQEINLLVTFADELVFALRQQQLQQELKRHKDELEIKQQQLTRSQHDIHRLMQEVQGKVWENYLNQQRERVNLHWNSDGTVAAWRGGDEAVTQQPSLGTTPQGLQRLVVPVRAGNQVLGEMVFESSAGTGWTQQTLDLVIEVAERLSLALENVRLFDQAQTIAFREQTVGSIAAELQDARSIGVLLDRAATIFNQVLGAQQTYIRLGAVHRPDAAGQRESLP